MLNEEFKLQFNTYFNNISSNQAPGANDYEISEFLTLAEEQIVAELYEGRFTGFEKTENLRKSLDALLNTKTIDVTFDADNIFNTNAYDGDIDYVEPDNNEEEPSEEPQEEVMFIVMEWADIVKSNKHITVEVIPIKYDDFLRTYNNPFRGVSSKRVLRLDTGNGLVKLHSAKDWSISEYRIEYLRKPKPIIIGNSDFTGFKINGYDAGTNIECELDSTLHRAILLRAVQLAKAAWQSK